MDGSLHWYNFSTTVFLDVLKLVQGKIQQEGNLFRCQNCESKLISKYIFFRIPIQTYFLLALLTLGTMGFSNASVGYLNYPTQVIFKCCKLIPVLIGGILIQGKRYGPLDFLAAVLMCVGLTLFTLGLYGF